MASTKVRIVCLANSRKHGGRCVAGLTWDMSPVGEWIRPISPYGTGELNWECFYSDTSEPRLLDIIDLAIAAPRPSSFHSEDCVVDPDQTWKKAGVAPFSQVAAYAEAPEGPLWVNAGSTSNGENDRVPAERTHNLTGSLKLIQPSALTLRAAVEDRDRQRKVVRGSFAFGPSTYTLAVTDPVIEREFAEKPLGANRRIRYPLLCLSVSELFVKRNEHYKLIAGVIEQN